MATRADLPALMILDLHQISDDDKAYFKYLWSRHVALLSIGKTIYFLPRSLGDLMGPSGLQAIAERLSKSTNETIYIHYNEPQAAYRIGEIVDEQDLIDLGNATLIYKLNDSLRNAASIAAEHGTSTNSNVKIEKIPKPRNMFIIYRQDKNVQVKADYPNMHTSEVSKIISAMWERETQEVKQHYKNLADEEKRLHQLRFPDYKCAPRKSSEIKKRQRSVSGNVRVSKSQRKPDGRRTVSAAVAYPNMSQAILDDSMMLTTSF